MIIEPGQLLRCPVAYLALYPTKESAKAAFVRSIVVLTSQDFIQQHCRYMSKLLGVSVLSTNLNEIFMVLSIEDCRPYKLLRILVGARATDSWILLDAEDPNFYMEAPSAQ